MIENYQIDQPGYSRQRIVLTDKMIEGRNKKEIVRLLKEIVHDRTRNKGTLLIDGRPVGREDTLKFVTNKFNIKK